MESRYPVFSPAQVRERDRMAIEDHGVPGYELMSRAGAAALAHARARWPDVRRPLVLCGVGNNAGDGYVFARLAADAGLEPTVVPLFDTDRLRGDAARAWEDYRRLSAGGRGVLADWSGALLEHCDLVVDAIFGTGLDRPVRGDPATVVAAVNDAERAVLALDVPSGVDAASGEVLGVAVEADLTVTFVGRKIGCYVGSGPDLTGTLVLADLGTEPLLGVGAERVADLLEPSLLAHWLTPRRRTSHKGDHGHVLVLGGGEGMSGAARLAAEAALYAGAGLVTVATAPAHAGWLNVGRPEIMCRGVRGPADLAPLLERADVLVAGPGLGTDDWAVALLRAALGTALPRVLDADALNLMAAGRVGSGNVDGAGEAPATVLTPHPGEAARLLSTTGAQVQADRLASVQRLASERTAVAVLKGAGSLVGAPGRVPALCARGNPGMAAGGMGDVLSGVVGALVAQLGDPWTASRAAVLAHALAGDDAAEACGAQRGLLAGDLFEHLRRRLNPVVSGA